MNLEAIFSDGTSEYVSPWEPRLGQTVKIRLRVPHGFGYEVKLVNNNYSVPMELDESGTVFDYYKVHMKMSDQPLAYVFFIKDGAEEIYYDRYGCNDEPRWQYAFKVVPGFETPDWAKGAVMYQILTDRFYNGDSSNDVETDEYYYISMHSQKVEDWDQNPDAFDVCKFYGGDLAGVKEKLYYLKSLGVEVIYFNPIFVSPSNHKYDAQDYDYIDPHYGCVVKDSDELLAADDNDNSHAGKYITRTTSLENLEASNEFFAEFVREAHSKGIRVILDGVFNHCGSFNKWLDREKLYENQEGYAKGAYISEDSPYRSFFGFNGDGQWPYNTAYDGWWGHDTLPKLNYEESEELCQYILDIGRKWVSPPYNCDGWRLDVAADLGHSEEFNHKFWARFREAVKDANPDAIVLAEHYGDATSWLQGDQWDTIMNYDAFMEPVSYFLTGMEKHSDAFNESALGNGAQFEATMRHHMTEFLTPSLYCSMNQLSNHDHSRFLTRTNHKAGRLADLGSEAAGEGVNVEVFKAGVVLMMTWPGAPTLYYGDEAGVVGFTDPDNRRTYPWGHADYKLIDFHRDIIGVRRTTPALKKGAFIFLDCQDNLISYGRFTKDQKVVVAINSSSEEISATLPVWKAEVPFDATMELSFMTMEDSWSIMPVKYDVFNGEVRLKLKPYQALVLEYNE